MHDALSQFTGETLKKIKKLATYCKIDKPIVQRCIVNVETPVTNYRHLDVLVRISQLPSRT